MSEYGTQLKVKEMKTEATIAENQKNSEFDVISRAVKVVISDDKMAASVLITATDELRSLAMTPQQLLLLISSKGIKSGIDQDKIDDIIRNKLWDKSIVIANGRKAVSGADAKFTFHFPTESSLKPKINPDYDETAYKEAKEYSKRVQWGPFEGTRPLEDDEK